MHSFLGAIGFSEIKTHQDTEKLLEKVKTLGSERFMTTLKDGRTMAEIRMEVSDNVGISIFGEYDEKNEFHFEHYYPYILGQNESAREPVFISKRVDTEAYTGMCEDYRLGVSMIFYLQNELEYVARGESDDHKDRRVTLAALSSEGKVLLPTLSMKESRVKEPVEANGHDQLLSAARNGDKEAMEALSLDEIDMYDKINERLKTEDIFSIVETTFIPYGSESDNYTILAMIESVSEHTNSITGENLVYMTLRCNGIVFPICINRKKLLGEPLPGRRFRGNVWMQGTVDFTL